jgi:STE24 endopeptidase
VNDLRALPALLLFVAIAGLVTLPLESSISRAFESTADDIAIELTDDPDAGVRAFRRLAFANIADLRPHQVAIWTLFSHPPIPERIRSVLGT